MKHVLWHRAVILCIVLILGLAFPAMGSAEKTIKAWTYYEYPPFVTGDGQGLSFDFIKLLNKHAKGKYKFKIVIYPRKRLDARLNAGGDGIVIFVNWSWMGDKEKTKYLWGPSILADRNEIISPAKREIIYDGTAESLHGLTFGGILGRRYTGLMEAMKRKDIIRQDVTKEGLNIRKLIQGRIDVTTMPKSMLAYFIKHMELQGQLFVSPTPMSSYTRHLLVTKSLHAEHEFLSEFVEGLAENAEWKEILNKYGF